MGFPFETELLRYPRFGPHHPQDSFLVEGVAFKKTFSYAGFEQQPKMFANPPQAAVSVYAVDCIVFLDAVIIYLLLFVFLIDAS